MNGYRQAEDLLLVALDLPEIMTPEALAQLFVKLLNLARHAGLPEGDDSPILGLALRPQRQRHADDPVEWYRSDRYWQYGFVIVETEEATRALQLQSRKEQGSGIALRPCAAKWKDPHRWFLIVERRWRPPGPARPVGTPPEPAP